MRQMRSRFTEVRHTAYAHLQKNKNYYDCAKYPCMYLTLLLVDPGKGLVDLGFRPLGVMSVNRTRRNAFAW